MNHKIIWLILSSLILLMTACDRPVETDTAEIDTTPVVAQAGGKTFHESDIDREIRSMPDTLQHVGNDPIARAQILNVLIRRSILSRQAEKIGLDHDPLIQNRIKGARDSILIEALENWQTTQVKAPAENEIAAYYKKHLTDFTIPEQIHARHILVGSEKLAWEILKKLGQNRDSFEALAATHSLDDSNKSRGGDLNWFPRGIMVDEFEKAAFSLKENALSKPVQTQFGWHVIEILGKKPAHAKSLDESRDEIINILQQDELEQWVEKLISKANVTVMKPEYQLSRPEATQESH